MSKPRLLSLILCAGLFLLPAVAQNTNPSAASSDENTLRQSVSNALITSTISRGTQDTSLVQVMISVWNAPENMAFDLSFRSGTDVWPVGPLAWKKGGTNQWSYEINLPETIKQVDVCFTPSRKAADQFVRSDPYWVGDLKTIWMGTPIIRQSVPIVDMGIGLMEIRPQLALGHVDPLDEVDESDPVIQQSDRYRDRDKVFAQLQQQAAAHPDNTRTLYNLGCVTVAKGNLEDAMKIFVRLSALGIPESLQRKVQRLLLIICEMNLFHADKREPAAMRLMGDAYKNGYGVKQLPLVAKGWYREAGNAGDPEAMCELAVMYDHEFGATVHTPEADAWYQRETLRLYREAAGQGNAEAKQWLASHDQH